LAATLARLVPAYPLPLPEVETEGSSRAKLGLAFIALKPWPFSFRSVVWCAAAGSNQGLSQATRRTAPQQRIK